MLASLIAGRRPRTPGYCVCLDCKRKGTVCVTVAQGLACLGPVTQAGCGAICPAYDRGCYGCFGPVRQSNCSSLSDHLVQLEHAPEKLVPLFRGFNGYSDEFRATSDRLAAHEPAGN